MLKLHLDIFDVPAVNNVRFSGTNNDKFMLANPP